jgi:hypothetical protein
MGEGGGWARYHLSRRDFWYTLLVASAAQQEYVQGKFLPDNEAYYAFLGLGIAGVAQRERKRTFAFLGIACVIFVFAFAFGQDVIPLF